MSDSGPKSLSDLIFGSHGPLRDLAEQAARRTDLAAHLRAGLPPELGAHLLGANLRPDGTLVVTADRPDWAARLRFESEPLLARGRQMHPESQRLRVRVGVPTAPDRPSGADGH